MSGAAFEIGGCSVSSRLQAACAAVDASVAELSLTPYLAGKKAEGPSGR